VRIAVFEYAISRLLQIVQPFAHDMLAMLLPAWFCQRIAPDLTASQAPFM
jgi:hypothetical protein